MVARLMTAAALGIALAGTGRAEPKATLPVAEAQPLPERARAVLGAHCTQCRDMDAGESALDLEVLAEDPRLVVPKRPDASRVYQRLLAAQATREGDAKSATSAPTPAEVETVRDWIESLPAREEACRDRARLTPLDVETRIDHWTEVVGHAEAADARFLSLVHLWNACVSPARLKQAREATASLLAGLAHRRDPLEIETLGDESAILVVRLRELALSADGWERLTKGAPTPLSPIAVPADWLAARTLAQPKEVSGHVDPAFEIRIDGASERAVQSLARFWSRDVDLVSAAAERGVTPRALAETLARKEGNLLHAAQRLTHGALGRAAWDSLSRALDGEIPDPAGLKHAVPDPEIDILLWTDKPFYRPRDLVTVNVSVSKACHLTLIDVDQDGKAIVLFPNELEPDNLIAPSVTVRVPGGQADYQFRFDRSGTEQIVATCQRTSRRPDGIDYDYERQRFAILGDWRTFLRTAQEREKEIRAREAAEDTRRRRRGRPLPAAAEPPAIDPTGPAVVGRAAIAVTIDPAGKI